MNSLFQDMSFLDSQRNVSTVHSDTTVCTNVDVIGTKCATNKQDSVQMTGARKDIGENDASLVSSAKSQ